MKEKQKERHPNRRLFKSKFIMLLLILVMGLTGCGTNNSDLNDSQNYSPNLSTKEAGETNDIEAGDMTVHFLDVGQGLSILVQSDGQNLLYDGGDRDTSSFVVSYLHDQGVSTIDYMISSHYDSDHMAGLIGCLNAYDVKTVITSDYVHNSKLYTSFMNALDDKGITPLHPDVGTTYDFGSGTFTILSPAEINQTDSNNNSVAIKLTNGYNNFIFTGDAEWSSEEAMCNSGIDLNCDVLVPGHHGSGTSTSWDFLQVTTPEYAVISCGAGNQYGHPHKDTMDKLKDMDIEVFRTDKQGTISCTSNGNVITWSVDPCNDYTPGDESDKGTQPSTSLPSQDSTDSGDMVWISATGKKYHSVPDCGTMNPDTAKQITKSEAEAEGLSACKICNP